MTTSEVAKLAGVSRTTVSKVINGHEGVAPETTRVVYTAMRQLGYVPTPRTGRPGRPRADQTAGRATRAIGTGQIGLLLVGRGRELLETPFNAAFLAGLDRAAQADHLSLVVAQMPRLSSPPPAVRHRSVDGLVVTARDPDPDVLAAVAGIPCVWAMGTQAGNTFVDQVLPNNEAIGVMAAEYLLEAGCRRIAFLDHDGGHSTFRDRQRAFCRAAQARGVEPLCLVSNGDVASSPGLWQAPRLRLELSRLVDRLPGGDRGVDGLFVPSDAQTAVVHQLLTERGLLPGTPAQGGRVRLISCNNDRPHLAGMHPRPAVIDPDPAALGRQAVRQLTHRIAHPDDPPVCLHVAPRLIRPEDACN